MAFFNLTDMKFSSSSSLTVKSLEESFKSYKIHKYPQDLGVAPDRLHYIIFHINTQEKSQYNVTPGGTGATSSTISARKMLSGMRGDLNIAGSIGSLIDKGKSQVSEFLDKSPNISNYLNSISQNVGTAKANLEKIVPDWISKTVGEASDQISGELKGITQDNFLRRTKRTTDTIALYMPNTLQFDLSQTYENISMTEALGMVGQAASASSALTGDDRIKNLTPFAAEILGKIGTSLGSSAGVVGEQFGKVALASLGYATNPQIEVLYQSPNLRKFQFEFMFYPRSSQEAISVQRIIKTFRFHSAPEILKNTGGRFLVPPSEFDIMFYHNGKENPNIPKIATCVLESVQVNYAPNGFSAYEVPQDVKNGVITDNTIGGTGMPYAIQMTLAFNETMLITKELIAGDASGDLDVKNGGQGNY